MAQLYYDGHYTYDINELDDVNWRYVDIDKYYGKECDNIMAMDTECNNGYYNPITGKVHHFDKKKYNGKKNRNKRYRRMIDMVCLPVSLTYKWMYAIEDATGEIKVWLGNDEDDYIKFREKLSMCIRVHANVSSKAPVYAYTGVHNLSYDFCSFLVNVADHMKMFTDKGYTVFARDRRKPIYARIHYWNIHWEYRCTLFYTNKSLRSAARDEDLPVQKEEAIDYTKLISPTDDLDEKTLKYAVMDVVVLVHLLNKARDTYGRISNIPLTSTGKIRRRLQRTALANPDFAEMCWTLTQSINFEMFLKLVKLYSGGWTHGNRRYINKKIYRFYRKHQSDIDYQLGGIDIRSEYPSVCCNYSGFPVTPFEKWDTYMMSQLEQEDVEHPKHAWFMKIRLKGVTSRLDNSLWSLSKAFDPDTEKEYKQKTVKKGTPVDQVPWDKDMVIDNGRIQHIERMGAYMTNIDWWAFKQAYQIDDYEVEELYVAEAGYLPRPLVEVILKAYADKTSFKGLGDTPEEKEKYKSLYKAAKELCNGIYGLLVYKYINTVCEFKDNEWQDPWFPSPENGGEAYYQKEIDDMRPETCHVYYPWGIWVTSAARNLRLWAAILPKGKYHSLPLGGIDDHHIYSDTDSHKAMFRKEDLEWIEEFNNHIIEENYRAAQHFGFDPELYSPKTKAGVPLPLGTYAFDDDDIDKSAIDPERPLELYNSFCTLGAKRYADETVDGVMHTTIAGLPKSAGVKVVKTIEDFNDGTFWDVETSDKVMVSYTEMPELDWHCFGDKWYHSTTKYAVNIRPTTFDMSMIPEFKAFLNFINGHPDPNYTSTNNIMMS